MSRNDRMILLVVPVIAALAAFWFLAIKPKQDKASKLDTQVSQLQSQVSTDQAAAQAGQGAREKFPQTYQRLVVMGKAVPVDDETASLMVQVNRIAKRSGVKFEAIDVATGSAGAAPAAPAPTAPAPTTPTTTPSTPTTPAAAVPAAPTEASAALLPIGATVGSAGLPTLPYSMTFSGSYFQIADFMAGVDGLVRTGKGTVSVDGRLATIDGFELQPTSPTGGKLSAILAITTYVTPASQGLTAGATPSGPAPTPVTPVQQAQSTVQSQNASSTATAAAGP